VTAWGVQDNDGVITGHRIGSMDAIYEFVEFPLPTPEEEAEILERILRDR
jgi:hypothetical protein